MFLNMDLNVKPFKIRSIQKKRSCGPVSNSNWLASCAPVYLGHTKKMEQAPVHPGGEPFAAADDAVAAAAENGTMTVPDLLLGLEKTCSDEDEVWAEQLQACKVVCNSCFAEITPSKLPLFCSVSQPCRHTICSSC